jgi:aerobic-type carbon monoxide dehydrogenase small subunit (CoxS/CutS family)
VKLTLNVNGRRRDVDVPPGQTLMTTLRGLGVVSVKDGCAHGDCGSCAVLLDGRAVTSCLLLTPQAEGHAIMTAEGLSDHGHLHPLQQALLDTGGVQCGFCTPGVLMAALDLLARTPAPTDAEIRLALAGSLCRCTGYGKIVEAVDEAAAMLRSTSGEAHDG